MTGAGRKVVAIVDDDDAVRDSLQLLLEVVGHRSEGFASAADFLRADPVNIVCLILDHHMPDMTGLELAGSLQSRGVTIPILLITGMPSPRIAAKAGELGVAKVVEKPPSEDDVLGFVAEHWGEM